jgi:hypothetical protein
MLSNIQEGRTHASALGPNKNITYATRAFGPKRQSQRRRNTVRRLPYSTLSKEMPEGLKREGKTALN